MQPPLTEPPTAPSSDSAMIEPALTSWFVGMATDAEIAIVHHQGMAALAIDRFDARAAVVPREHAQHAMRACAKPECAGVKSALADSWLCAYCY